jgi:hypothetical protein
VPGYDYRLLLVKQVAQAFENHDARAWNARAEGAQLRHRHRPIDAASQDEEWYTELRKLAEQRLKVPIRHHGQDRGDVRRTR